MNLESTGMVIRLQKFQEDKYIVYGFTKEYGILSGIARRSKSSKSSQVLVPGNIGLFSWYARLEEQLGYINFEPTLHVVALLHHDRNKLALLQSILALISVFITEREAYSNLFDNVLSLLNDLVSSKSFNDSMVLYCRFELDFLQEIGYGLDLDKCVVSKTTHDLTYVSPKSGCAVSMSIGKEYHNKLLSLSSLLLSSESEYSNEDIVQALKLTGFFLHKAAAEVGKEHVLNVRNQLVSMLMNKSSYLS